MISWARPRGRTLVLLCVVAGLTAACGLPRSGPNKREIYSSSELRQGDAFVLSVNDRVTRLTSVVPVLGFSSAFLNAGVVGSDTIHAGDTLALTIYENVNDGLLATQGQRVAALNEVQVDGDGFIFVPYAGRIRAAGSTPDGLRQIITKKLDPQTPDPQVTVARVAGNGSTVSVIGSIGGQGVYPIERPTRTLTAMLARAGGVTISPESAEVTVIRGNQKGHVWLQDLYSNANLDVPLRGGDRILVQEDRRSFTALGATGSQTRVRFDTQTISAIEAIATVGGLSSGTADPTGVFVLRNEPAEIAKAVLGRTDLVGDQRFVYVLDLTEPMGMFYARDFAIRDQDTVYVTEAPFVQWQKVLSAITGSAAGFSGLQNVGALAGAAAN